MLEMRGICKSFEQKNVLKGVDLSVDRGEVYGLVGENGAGKTTLMNIAVCLLKKDAGEVIIDGKRVEGASDVYKKVGYMLDIPSMYEYMSAYEYFEFLGAFSDMQKEEVKKRSGMLLEMVGLKDVGKTHIKSFSRGMKQRMGIAAGLLNDPGILILDEPSSALDPMGRYEVAEIIKNLSKEGKTVLLSTHILSDVEKVCKRIGLLIGGKIKIEGSVEEILYRYSKPYYNIVPANKEKAKEVGEFLIAEKCCDDIKYYDGLVCALTDGSDESKRRLFQSLLKTGEAFDSVALNKATVEQIFIQEAR